MNDFFSAFWQAFWFTFTLGTGSILIPLVVLGALFILGIIIGIITRGTDSSVEEQGEKGS